MMSDVQVSQWFFSFSLRDCGWSSPNCKRLWKGSCLQRRKRKKIEECLASNKIREMHKMWEIVKFYRKAPPNKVIAVWVMNLLNYNAISHLHEVLKGGKSKCQWTGYLLELYKKKKIPLSNWITVIPLVIPNVVLHNNLPLTFLLHTSHEGF